MGIISQDDPSVIRLGDLNPQDISNLRDILSYNSKTKQYDLQRLKNNHFFKK
jgi:hypothetical protein